MSRDGEGGKRVHSVIGFVVVFVVVVLPLYYYSIIVVVGSGAGVRGVR